MEVENKQEDYNKEKMYLGTTYLLEESALFTCLATQGWSVLVYPGSIKTFEEILEGLHPEVPLRSQRSTTRSHPLRTLTAQADGLA